MWAFNEIVFCSVFSRKKKSVSFEFGSNVKFVFSSDVLEGFFLQFYLDSC